MPFCPVNHSTPWRSKLAVFRWALRRSLGSGKSFTARVAGSTRATAFCPPSVTHAAPSGPTITPWGAAPDPRAIISDLPVLGSSRPSLPADCAVNQTTPAAVMADDLLGDHLP